jgi:outer membrane protein assembly factor BamB
MGMRASVIVCGLLLAQAGWGQDWPRFRGPEGRGVSEARNLPVALNAGSLAWRTPAPAGASSPIVSRDRVFVAGFDGSRRILVCLSLDTGRELWRREIEVSRAERRRPPNDAASSTPVTDGSNVYVLFSDYGLLSYTLAGEGRWRTPLGPFNPPHGMSSSPIVAGRSVIVLADQASDSFLAAFELADGRLQWKTSRPSFAGSYSTPAVCNGEIIVPGPVELVAYALENGQRRWSAPNVGAMPISVPVCEGDTIYVSNAGLPPYEDMAVSMKADRNGDGKISPDEFPDPAFQETVRSIDRTYGNGDGAIDAKEWDGALNLMRTINALVALQADGPQASERWRITKTIPDVPSLLVYRDVLYLIKDGGILTSLNPENGEVFKQARLAGMQDRFFASPVAADGKVFLVSETCKVAAIRAAPEWELLGTSELADECYATPAIVEGGILIRSKTALHFFHPTGGARR